MTVTAETSAQRVSRRTQQGYTLMDSITISELNAFKDDLPAYIRYLLRVGAFKTMADMARDLGVKNERVRQAKYRENIKRSD